MAEEYKPTDYNEVVSSTLLAASAVCTTLGKYAGLLIGVAGVVDDWEPKKIIVGGAAAIICGVINWGVNYQHRVNSFSALEKRIVNEIREE